MSRATYIIDTEAARARMLHDLRRAALGFSVDAKRWKRTLPQNDRLHAMITPISQQLLWHGQKMSVADWKLVFMDALNREMRIVPNIAGDGLVNLGRKTSALTVSECNELMDFIEAFAAQHGIDLWPEGRAA